MNSPKFFFSLRSLIIALSLSLSTLSFAKPPLIFIGGTEVAKVDPPMATGNVNLARIQLNTVQQDTCEAIAGGKFVLSEHTALNEKLNADTRAAYAAYLEQLGSQITSSAAKILSGLQVASAGSQLTISLQSLQTLSGFVREYERFSFDDSLREDMQSITIQLYGADNLRKFAYAKAPTPFLSPTPTWRDIEAIFARRAEGADDAPFAQMQEQHNQSLRSLQALNYIVPGAQELSQKVKASLQAILSEHQKKVEADASENLETYLTQAGTTAQDFFTRLRKSLVSSDSTETRSSQSALNYLIMNFSDDALVSDFVVSLFAESSTIFVALNTSIETIRPWQQPRVRLSDRLVLSLIKLGRQSDIEVQKQIITYLLVSHRNNLSTSAFMELAILVLKPRL